MAATRFNDPIEPMTIANMRESGVRSLAFWRHRCHHERTMNVDHLPGDLTVPSFILRMVCTKCGIVGADVRPNWQELKNKLPALGSRGTLLRPAPSEQEQTTGVAARRSVAIRDWTPFGGGKIASVRRGTRVASSGRP
jgi:hypothetical protein